MSIIKREIKEKIIKVVEILKKAKDILFITGAGISADSGLPTYRGPNGIYNNKFTEDGIPIEVALSGQMLNTKPEITWKYIMNIENKCRKARFNKAHKIIAEMENHFNRVWVLTQNIDGFHRDAGSKNIIDIHGDIHNLCCLNCNWKTTIKDYSFLDNPPKCPKCNKIIRPDVVFFGEFIPENKLEILNQELKRGFDIYFSIGTTSVFPYIQEPIIRAKYLNKTTVEINPSETEISDIVDIKIPLRAVSSLSLIWQYYIRL